MTTIRTRIMRRILAFALVVSSMVSMISFTSQAEDISETNPELTKYDINSDIETKFGSSAYNPKSTLTQQGNKYTITSNAYVPYHAADDVTFAYRTYNVTGDKNDTLTYEVTVNSVKGIEGTAHANRHAGIMFRSGLGPEAAEVCLHTREKTVTLLYRTLDGQMTSYREDAFQITYPIQLKLEKVGGVVSAWYKDATHDQWMTFAKGKSVNMSCNGPLYAGLAVSSVNENISIEAEFQDIKVSGTGSYTGGEGNDGDGSGSEVPDQPQLPEAETDVLPTNPDVMLYETFTDANMTDGQMAIGNYSWSSSKGAIETMDENRYLYREFDDVGYLYVGDEKWTDYQVSAHVQFTDSNDTGDPSINDLRFRLIARTTRNIFYGVSGYAADVRLTDSGPVLSLYKMFNEKELSTAGTLVQVSSTADGTALQTKGVVPLDFIYGDGLWHEISIRAVDNRIQVYWDKVCLIDYTDQGSGATGDISDVASQGRIGVMTNGCDLMFDNLCVTRINDPVNGDYDNYIGGLWDKEIPEYVLAAYNDGVGNTGISVPSTPKLFSYSKSPNSITLDADNGYEYQLAISVGNSKEWRSDWQDSPTFTGEIWGTYINTGERASINGLSSDIQLNFYRRSKITGLISKGFSVVINRLP